MYEKYYDEYFDLYIFVCNLFLIEIKLYFIVIYLKKNRMFIS